MNYNNMFGNIKAVINKGDTLDYTASILIREIDEGYPIYGVEVVDDHLVLVCWPQHEGEEPLTNLGLGDILDDFDGEQLTMQVKVQVDEGGKLYNVIGSDIVVEDGEGSDIWDEDVLYFYTA